MAFYIRHVRKREGVFQYERRVPLDIVRDPAAWQTYFGGKPLYRRSLHTKDQAKVLLAAELERGRFEALVAQARGRPAHQLERARPAPRSLDVEVLKEISDTYHRITFVPWRDAYIRAELGGDAAAELERMKHEREMDAEVIRDVLLNPGAAASGSYIGSPVDLARDAVRDWGIDVADGSNEFATVVAAVRKGMLAGQRDIDVMLEGKGAPVIPPKKVSRPNGITIRETVERYLKDKSVRPKTAAEVMTSLEMFERLVGNKELQALARADFQQFLGHMAAKVVGGQSEGSVRRPIAEGTVKKRLGFLRTAINHALDRGLFEGANPAAGFNVSAWIVPPDKTLTPNKRGFRVHELNRIFEHPWFTGCQSAKQIHLPGQHRLDGTHYWAPMVALMTGCRVAELGGLMLNEISLKGPHPHIIIRANPYRPIKGDYARSVPILDALLDLGFETYVERVTQAGADRLFPDWQSPRGGSDFTADDARWSNATVIRSFNRNVVTWALGDTMVPGARKEVTFHSFRGAFKAMLGLKRHGIPSNVINEVIGHAKSEMDGRYVGEIPLEETYPAVRACTFSGLVLPTAPI